MIVALFSENDWKMNQTAVLCALQTFDVYQKERVDSVKYIQHMSMSTDLTETTISNSESSKNSHISTAAEVTLWFCAVSCNTSLFYYCASQCLCDHSVCLFKPYFLQFLARISRAECINVGCCYRRLCVVSSLISLFVSV